jgi:hypothetical protein
MQGDEDGRHAPAQRGPENIFERLEQGYAAEDQADEQDTLEAAWPTVPA